MHSQIGRSLREPPVPTMGPLRTAAHTPSQHRWASARCLPCGHGTRRGVPNRGVPRPLRVLALEPGGSSHACPAAPTPSWCGRSKPGRPCCPCGSGAGGPSRASPAGQPLASTYLARSALPPPLPSLVPRCHQTASPYLIAPAQHVGGVARPHQHAHRHAPHAPTAGPAHQQTGNSPCKEPPRCP